MSSPEKQEQWRAFLDAVGHETVTSQNLAGEDTMVMLFSFSIIIGEAHMPLFERRALRMVQGTPNKEVKPTWLDLITIFAHWISFEGRALIAETARRYETHGSIKRPLKGYWRYRTSQISVGHINPEWSDQDLGEYISIWVDALWREVLSRHAPMVFPAAFASRAGTVISTLWAPRYLLEGIVPEHYADHPASEQQAVRLNTVLDVVTQTPWNMYDLHTWLWFTGLQLMETLSDEKEVLTNAMCSYHPQLYKTYQKFEPIVSSFAGTPLAQALLYIELIREEHLLLGAGHDEIVEIPVLD